MSKARFCPVTGKVSYDPDAARAAAQAVNSRLGTAREKLYAYACANCGDWHIGRTKPDAWAKRGHRARSRRPA